MISRYARPEMVALWTDQSRLEIMLEIEVLAAEAMARRGWVPMEAVAEVREKARVDADRVKEIERVTRHDVNAFLDQVAESVGPAARVLHRGMTSSDVLDTAFAVQLGRAGAMILEALDDALVEVATRAHEHRNTLQMGRTHGIHAEPISFGQKLALWYDEMQRGRDRLVAALEGVRVGKISGAVGTFAFLDPEIEEEVCDALGLAPAPASNQIVQRDRHAALFSALALLGSSIEKFAVEIRHLQRTEVREAREGFSKGQKGSSAMPHKRNPILTENLSGLARLLRGYSMSALENVPLWHERDISHSSVERVIGPDATILTQFMLLRFATVMRNLVVDANRMQENIDEMRGIHLSQSLLLALVDVGVERQAAYVLVQRAAMRVWDEGLTFSESVESDAELCGLLSSEARASALDNRRYLAHVDAVFTRVFGASAEAEGA